MRRQGLLTIAVLGIMLGLSLAATCVADQDDDGQQTLPTSAPTSAATFEIDIPNALTPTPAADAGREDCPQDWAAYNDPDGYFSVCYPADWEANVSEPQAYFGHGLAIRAPTDPTTGLSNYNITLYWSESSSLSTTVRANRCDLGIWENYKEITLEAAGRSVLACTGEPVGFGEPPAGYEARRTFAEIPLPKSEGYVVVSFSELFKEGGSPATATQVVGVLDSLRTK